MTLQPDKRRLVYKAGQCQKSSDPKMPPHMIQARMLEKVSRKSEGRSTATNWRSPPRQERVAVTTQQDDVTNSICPVRCDPTIGPIIDEMIDRSPLCLDSARFDRTTTEQSSGQKRVDATSFQAQNVPNNCVAKMLRMCLMMCQRPLSLQHLICILLNRITLNIIAH